MAHVREEIALRPRSLVGKFRGRFQIPRPLRNKPLEIFVGKSCRQKRFLASTMRRLDQRHQHRPDAKCKPERNQPFAQQRVGSILHRTRHRLHKRAAGVNRKMGHHHQSQHGKRHALRREDERQQQKHHVKNKQLNGRAEWLGIMLHQQHREVRRQQGAQDHDAARKFEAPPAHPMQRHDCRQQPHEMKSKPHRQFGRLHQHQLGHVQRNEHNLQQIKPRQQTRLDPYKIRTISVYEIQAFDKSCDRAAHPNT